MNHMTVIEDYFCDICQSSQWSDCGNPFNRELDGTDTCNKCHKQFYTAKCSVCKKDIELLSPIEHGEDYFCDNCPQEPHEVISDGLESFIISWLIVIIGITLFKILLNSI